MAKLLLIALGAFVWKQVTGRWPWQPADSAANAADRRARALLGVQRSASHAEIIEAHRRLIAMVHPDKGGTSEQVHEANDARDLLLARLVEGPATGA
ncbi:MAG: J domain-containing protein [Sphingomonadales bacterium]|nr:J domain-containing protein [Sphingomonadales bacterium]